MIAADFSNPCHNVRLRVSRAPDRKNKVKGFWMILKMLKNSSIRCISISSFLRLQEKEKKAFLVNQSAVKISEVKTKAQSSNGRSDVHPDNSLSTADLFLSERR